MSEFEAKLSRDLPRGVEGHEDKSPDVEWARPANLHPKYRYDESGIYLGRRAVADGVIADIGWNDDRHVLLVAGSRAGKGRSFTNVNALRYSQGSMLIVDPKGELARKTAKQRRTYGDVVIIDPFGASGLSESLGGWNPLDEISFDAEDVSQPIDDALSIAEAMIQAPKSGETHWAEAAQGLVQALILFAKIMPQSEDRNLCTVRDLLMLGHGSVITHSARGELEPLQALFDLMKVKGDEFAENNPHAVEVGFLIRDTGVTFGAMAEKELESVLSTARTQTRFLNSPAIRAVLGSSALDLAELKRGVVSLYLCLPAGRMGSHAKWLRVIINMALIAFERETTKPPVPVLMLLEEFPVLGHMRSIEVAAGNVAGFGVKLWTVVQDLSQLKDLYQSSWETFIGNAGVSIFFGNSDMTTLEYISKKLGQRSMIVRVKSGASIKSIADGASGVNESLQTVPLLASHEVERMLDRETKRALVMVAGRKPLIVERIFYDEELKHLL